MKKTFSFCSILLGAMAAAAISNLAAAQSTIADSTTFLSTEVEEVVVARRGRGDMLSKKDNITTTVITKQGLQKLACCSLAESFENTAAVTVGYADAVTGARTIRLMGLSGAYTSLTTEAVLMPSGLSGVYALEYTPGAWMENIQVAKGISPVSAGIGGTTGAINMELRKPQSNDLLYLNAYVNSDVRTELNAVGTIRVSDALQGTYMAHASRDFLGRDMNKDGFLDMPIGERAAAATRWLYTFGQRGAELRSGLRLTYDNRQGGSMQFRKREHIGSSTIYGSGVLGLQGNAYAKLGIPFGDSMQHSAAITADYTAHEQASYFGTRYYDAVQNNFSVNAMLNLSYGSMHKVVAGLSATGDVYDERLSNSISPVYSDATYASLGWGSGGLSIPYIDGDASRLYAKNEYAAGAYSEYTYHIEKKLSAIAGGRLEWNNLYGMLLSPRAHIRWNVVPDLTFRASGGRGYNSVRQLAQNQWMLATNRTIVMKDAPKIESAWTYGGNLTYYIRTHDHEDGEDAYMHESGGEEKGYLSVEFFRTRFTNQYIVDQEISDNKIWLYNLDGKSYSNTVQADVSVEWVERLTTLMTFRYSDTRVQLREAGLARKPLVDVFKALVNVSYATKFSRWMFDLTAQVNGQSRLPSTSFVERDNTAAYSPVYPLLFMQVTRRFKGVDVYVGCENILDYMQREPVISANAPFESKFNASIVWGPLRGRTFYAGLRWTIGRTGVW